MPRRKLSPNDREAWAKPILWDARSALYIHPGNYTTAGLMQLGASVAFLAIPPVTVTVPSDSNYLPVKASGGDVVRPTHLELYREDDFWWRVDATADTRDGAFRAGGAVGIYPINPAVATLSFVSTVNTAPLRATWLWGIG